MVSIPVGISDACYTHIDLLHVPAVDTGPSNASDAVETPKSITASRREKREGIISRFVSAWPMAHATLIALVNQE